MGRSLFFRLPLTALLGMGILAGGLSACTDREEPPPAVPVKSTPLPADDESFAIKNLAVADDYPFTGIGWVSLVPAELVEVLARMGPATGAWEFPLKKSPSATAADAGTLVIRFSDAKGLSGAFRAPGAFKEKEFTPDLYDPDWGYGPWFHQTVMEVDGEWVLLPKEPFPEPVWVNAIEAFGGVTIHTVAERDVYRYKGRNVTVVATTADELLVRAEQPADRWCAEGDPPPVADAPVEPLPFSSLFDGNGHLKLDVVYKRGC